MVQSLMHSSGYLCSKAMSNRSPWWNWSRTGGISGGAVFSVLLAGMLCPAQKVKPISSSQPTVNASAATQMGFAKDGKGVIPSVGEDYGLRVCALPGMVEAVNRSRAGICGCTAGNQTHWADVRGTWGNGSWFNDLYFTPHGGFLWGLFEGVFGVEFRGDRLLIRAMAAPGMAPTEVMLHWRGRDVRIRRLYTHAPANLDGKPLKAKDGFYSVASDDRTNLLRIDIPATN